MKLLNENELRFSNIVANCKMNRERLAFGDNSYQQDISINPYVFLSNRLEVENKVNWLDICCGRGKALIQVAKKTIKDDTEDRFNLVGVDLAGMFDPIPVNCHHLKLIELPLEEFTPLFSFDLITCVHGLHYIGDKLNAISQLTGYLKPDGIFLANLDTNNIFDAVGNNKGKKINSFLRSKGMTYDTRKKLLRCNGNKNIKFPFQYLGADDRFGKNYTGQKVVASYYNI